MAITLTPLPPRQDQILAGDLLRVIGDVENTLVIPAERKRVVGGETWTHSYYISLSDGSLIRASNDPECPAFHVIRGRAVVDDTGQVLMVPGKIDWVTLASNCAAIAVAQEPAEALPLFA